MEKRTMKPLYAKDKRDACIIVAVNYRKYDLGDIDEILENQRLTKLSKGIDGVKGTSCPVRRSPDRP